MNADQKDRHFTHPDSSPSANLWQRIKFTTKSQEPISHQTISSPEIQPDRLDSAEQVSNHSKRCWQIWLLTAALVVYLAVRFIGLDSYPIYFFTDEAIQTVLVGDLVRDGFRDYQGELLPTFLKNGGQYNLGTSVYLQILPRMLFGKSIWVTRGTSVLLSLLAALSVGLLLRNTFKSNYAYVGVMLLSITPAWFLHSRTAFEVVIAVSFYAAFLNSYVQYLSGKTKYLFAAVAFGVLCFYSYSPAQLVMLVSAVLFIIFDFRTHLKNWKTLLIGLGMTLLLAIPYLRFLALHPTENLRHFEILDSYWIQSIPLTEKFGIYFKEYLKLLNPFYWFIPNDLELERHVMKGYGHLLYWTLPLFLLGLGIALRWFKNPRYRVLVLSLLAAPTGSALAGAAVTRSLFLVIPAVVLTTIGLDQVLRWVEKAKIRRGIIVCLSFIGLLVGNGLMLRDALVNGPLWYTNYSLGGQQYGARQVFGEIRHMLNENPDIKVYLSPSWANGTDVLARFFFDDPLPFEMGSIDGYLYEKHDIPDEQIFVLIPEEIKKVKESRKFKNMRLLKTINYPNGEPGFFFIQLEYVDNINQVLARELAERQKLLESSIVDQNGNQLRVSYPRLDMGEIRNLFDGDGDSLARTAELNPMILEINLDKSKQLSEITVRIGGSPSTIEITIKPEDGSLPVAVTQSVGESNDLRDVVFIFAKPIITNHLEISVKNTNDSDRAHIHVWEVNLK